MFLNRSTARRRPVANPRDSRQLRHPQTSECPRLARRSSPLVFHFTPTSASWLNAVEGFFSILTPRRLKRGVFQSVADLQDAIARYIRAHNKTPKPFVWKQPAKTILAKLDRLPAPSV